MIVRIVRIRVHPGREKDWQDSVEAHSIPWLNSLSGLVACYPGRPTPGGDARGFVFVTVFETPAAMEAALGEGWKKPVLLGDQSSLVESAEVEHYDAFGHEKPAAETIPVEELNASNDE